MTIKELEFFSNKLIEAIFLIKMIENYQTDPYWPPYLSNARQYLEFDIWINFNKKIRDLIWC